METLQGNASDILREWVEEKWFLSEQNGKYLLGDNNTGEQIYMVSEEVEYYLDRILYTS